MGNDFLESIKRSAIAKYPQEACGFILSVGNGKSTFYEAKNTSPNPEHFFVIHPNEYQKASEIGEIVGVWHTHVEIGPQPSEADKVGCENSALPWYILGVFKNDNGFEFSELFSFEPNGYEAPYLGRPYAYGALDCWSLVRDYYGREFGIKLGDYTRIKEFWRTEHNFFEDNWEKEELVNVTGRPLAIGDILYFQTDDSGKPNHAGIYSSNERILHHAMGRLSKEDIYTHGSYWEKHTVKQLRHKSKCS